MLFVVLTVVGVCLGWEFGQIRRRAKAVAVIESFGGYVEYDYRMTRSGYRPDAIPPGPKWLRRILGEFYATNVIQVQLFARADKPPKGRTRRAEDFTDVEAQHIAALTELDWLVLDDTKITDNGLAHLAGLKKLGRLDLGRTQVTRAGVERLHRALPQACIVFGDDDHSDAIGPELGSAASPKARAW